MSESEISDSKDLPAPRKGFARLLAATKYSLAGISAAFKREEAFRIEVVLFVLLTPVGIYLGETATEKVLLIASLILVLLIELINTAIEAVVDRFGREYHDLAKIAKDSGSAAVAISLLLVLFTWGMLLL